MKIQYLALYVLTLVFACKKEETPDEETSNVRYVTSIVSKSDSTRYEYTVNHELRRKAAFWGGQTDSVHADIFFPQYTGGIVTSINFTRDSNSPNGAPKYSVLYNADGRIGTLVAQSGASYDSIVYDGQGQVTERYFILLPRSIKYRTELTWKDGNVVKVIRNLVPANEYDVITYTYDNHPNMFKPWDILSLTKLDEFHHLSKNNVTRIDYDFAANRPGEFIQSELFSYYYDEYSYPVKMLLVNEVIQHGDTSTSKLTDTSRITYLP